jgi:membrane-associated phospholipid phosphatase
MHYATDVITGAVVGTAIGLGVPAIHYASATPGEHGPALAVRIVPTPGGVAIAGELP